MTLTTPVSPLFRDSRMVIYLFIAFRLMMLIVYQPLDGVGPGITVFGDFQHYYNFATLSAGGALPYRDYWYEFPPVFPIVSLTIYGLTHDFTGYAISLGFVMICFDLGSLLLLRRIGTRLHGESTGTALAWVYALMAVPLVFSSWTFEPMVAFSVLLALAWLLEGKARQADRSAFAVAFGALTKLFPLISLAAVWRFRPWRLAFRYTVIAIGVSTVGLLTILLIGGKFGVPSLVAQFNKASYQSVWALIDRNYKTGNFGPIIDHFDPAKASDLQGNPPVIPWWLRSGVFAVIGLYVYATTRRFDFKGITAFVTITITIFFLWSQGWSPQWQMILVPLILLNFPTREGVFACLMLAFISFVDYPLLFSRMADTDGAINATQLPLFTAIVLLRTGILIGLAAALPNRTKRCTHRIAELTLTS